MLHAQDIKSLQPDKRLFTPSEVYTTFKKMSDSDLHLLGLSDEYARPEWMILTVLPVPPPPVRPSIAVDGGAMRSEDDLTYKLGDIIKASANVRRCEQEGAPAHVINEFEQLLQVCHMEPFFGSVLLNSSSSTLPLTWTMTSLGFLRHYRNLGVPLRLFVRV
jgi:DNA-directed RNA polymerase beta' subunit